MVNLLFIPVLLFVMVSNLLAGDYWVYLRKVSNITDTQNAEQIRGRPAAGDIIDVLLVSPQFVPTDKERVMYHIIKVIGLEPEDAIEMKSSQYDVKNSTNPIIIKYRKNKLPIKDVNSKEVYSIAEISTKIIDKATDNPVILPSK